MKADLYPSLAYDLKQFISQISATQANAASSEASEKVSTRFLCMTLWAICTCLCNGI